MRSLKFRAWDERHKRLCYGYNEKTGECDDDPYWRDGDSIGPVGMVNSELNGRSDFNIDELEPREDGIGYDYIDKYHYVWEQYTGLKDKNGKEIYEGDIVRWCGGFYEIYFDVVQGWRGIDRRGVIPKGQTLYQMTINNVDKPNIVGNIHENPELILTRSI